MTASQRTTFDESQDLKAYLLALSTEQVAALRLSYAYRSLQVGLRDTGVANLLLGGLTFLFGIGLPGDPLLKAFQAFLGLATVFISLWSIVSPRPIGIAIWAGILGIVGIWNIFVAIYSQNLFGGIWGLLQLWWTYGLYHALRKNTAITWPDAESVRAYNDLQRAVRRFSSKTKKDPDFIRLKFNRRWWQGFLLQDWIVLTPQRGIALLIAERSKTTFTFKDGKGIWRARIAGTADLDDTSIKRITFPQTTFERYNRWKELPDSETAEWLNELDHRTRKRRPIRITIILTLAAPIVFLLCLASYAVMIVITYSK